MDPLAWKATGYPQPRSPGTGAAPMGAPAAMQGPDVCGTEPDGANAVDGTWVSLICQGPKSMLG